MHRKNCEVVTCVYADAFNKARVACKAWNVSVASMHFCNESMVFTHRSICGKWVCFQGLKERLAHRSFAHAANLGIGTGFFVSASREHCDHLLLVCLILSEVVCL